MKKTILLIFIMMALFSTSVFAGNDPLAPGLKYKDPYTIVGDKNLAKDIVPLNADGSVNFVIAIPVGTNAKWEVDEKSGSLVWDKNDNKPRVIQYLGYIGNWGLIPRTVGSDKEMLAALVIGEPALRGAVVKAKVIGSFKLVNRKGVVTDKIIAVAETSPLYAVNTISELNEKYPGITTIIETWFTQYNGIGRMKVAGFLEADEAMEIVSKAVLEYK